MVNIHRRGVKNARGAKSVGLSPFELHKLEQERKENRARADTEAVYEDFVKSFEVEEKEEEQGRKGGLGFVKGGTAFSTNDDDDDDVELTKPKKKKGIYLPPPTVAGNLPPRPTKKLPLPMEDEDDAMPIGRAPRKKNIDDLMEDIKKKQEARDRIGVKELPPVVGAERKGSFDAGDPTTTNIFVGNLSPDINEEMLLRLFGKYGPIASIKVMWPRTEEEHARGHVSGFVAFMERIDAEAAHDGLRRYALQGRDLRLAWGRAVARPNAPMPPAEGMQYGGSAARSFVPDESMLRADSAKDEIRVEVPLDLVRRREINLLAAFIAKEGLALERAVTAKESAIGSAARFKFLFDPKEMRSMEGMYYRWRVYSLLQGDRDDMWRTAPFATLENGALIYPPTCGRPLNNPANTDDSGSRAKGAAAQDGANGDLSSMDGQLSDDDVKRLTQLLRGLSWQRESIADAMLFCISRASCAGDVVSIVAESLTLQETPINLKIARLFLVSDVLHNSAVASVKNAWVYRSRFQVVLEDVFKSLGASYRSIDGRLTANAVRSQIERVVGAWERWSLYAPQILEKYRGLFTGEVSGVAATNPASEDPEGVAGAEEGVDGEPLDGEPLDGEPLDGEPLDGEDLDGEPLDDNDDVDGKPLSDEDKGKDNADEEDIDGESI